MFSCDNSHDSEYPQTILKLSFATTKIVAYAIFFLYACS